MGAADGGGVGGLGEGDGVAGVGEGVGGVVMIFVDEVVSSG